jgi:hypothetical protein
MRGPEINEAGALLALASALRGLGVEVDEHFVLERIDFRPDIYLPQLPRAVIEVKIEGRNTPAMSRRLTEQLRVFGGKLAAYLVVFSNAPDGDATPCEVGPAFELIRASLAEGLEAAAQRAASEILERRRALERRYERPLEKVSDTRRARPRKPVKTAQDAGWAEATFDVMEIPSTSRGPSKGPVSEHTSTVQGHARSAMAAGSAREPASDRCAPPRCVGAGSGTVPRSREARAADVAARRS